MLFEPGSWHGYGSDTMHKFLTRMGTYETKPYWCWRGRRWMVVNVNPLYTTRIAKGMTKPEAEAMVKLLTAVNKG